MDWEAGDVIGVRYRAENTGRKVLFHEMIVLQVLPGSPQTYAVVGDDGSQFNEDLSADNGEILEIVDLGGLGGRPADIGRKKVSAFTPLPTADEIAEWMRVACSHNSLPLPQESLSVRVADGTTIVVDLATEALDAVIGDSGKSPAVHVSTGLAALGLSSSQGGVVASPPTTASFIYVYDEPTVAHEVGEKVDLPLDHVVLQGGSRILARINGDEVLLKRLDGGTNLADYAFARKSFLCVDRRILEEKQATDARTFTRLVSDMPVVAPPNTPLVGPSTASWFLDQVAVGGMPSMVARHHRWKTDSGVRSNLPAVYEHEVISSVLDIAVITDRLNVKNLVSFELLLRRLQLQESAITESPENPSYEGARHFMGIGERRGGALIAPALSQYVAAELGKEAAILKEKRKAREARGKGSGKTGAAEGQAAASKAAGAK